MLEGLVELVRGGEVGAQVCSRVRVLVVARGGDVDGGHGEGIARVAVLLRGQVFGEQAQRRTWRGGGGGDVGRGTRGSVDVAVHVAARGGGGDAAQLHGAVIVLLEERSAGAPALLDARGRVIVVRLSVAAVALSSVVAERWRSRPVLGKGCEFRRAAGRIVALLWQQQREWRAGAGASAQAGEGGVGDVEDEVGGGAGEQDVGLLLLGEVEGASFAGQGEELVGAVLGSEESGAVGGSELAYNVLLCARPRRSMAMSGGRNAAS